MIWQEFQPSGKAAGRQQRRQFIVRAVRDNDVLDIRPVLSLGDEVAGYSRGLATQKFGSKQGLTEALIGMLTVAIRNAGVGRADVGSTITVQDQHRALAQLAGTVSR